MGHETACWTTVASCLACPPNPADMMFAPPSSPTGTFSPYGDGRSAWPQHDTLPATPVISETVDESAPLMEESMTTGR